MSAFDRFIQPFLGPDMPGLEQMPPAEPSMSPMQVTPPGSQGPPLGGAIPERPHTPRDKWEKLAIGLIMASMIAGKKKRPIHQLAGAYLKGKGMQRGRAEGEWQQEKGEQEKKAQWMREMTLTGQTDDRRRIDQRLFREAGWEEAARIRGEGREYEAGIAEEDRRREAEEARQEELQRMRALDAFSLEDRRWLEMGLRPPAGSKPGPTLGAGAAGILGTEEGELSEADLEVLLEAFQQKGMGERARISAAGKPEDKGEGMPYSPTQARADLKTQQDFWLNEGTQDNPGVLMIAQAAWLRRVKAGYEADLPLPGSTPPVKKGPGFLQRVGQWFSARKTMPLTNKQKGVIADLEAQGKSKAEIRKLFLEHYGYEMP